MKSSTIFSGIVLFIATTPCFSQQIIRRFEVGTQTTMLRTLGQTDWCAACPTALWSVGPAVTFSLNQHFAIDGAFGFFPGPSDNPSWLVGGHVTETLVGIKAGVHGSRFSLFAKVRPGYARWSRGRVSNIQFPDYRTIGVKDGVVYVDPGQPVYSYKPRTNFVLDVGGGVEYALTRTLALRADMGDTLIYWHRSDPSWDPPSSAFKLSNNLQISTGLFSRFGSKIQLERPATESPHKFFDRTNLALFSASALAQLADGITTQRFMANCRKNWAPPPNYPYGCEQWEADPLARPFVAHGWGGQIALGAIVNTVQTSVTYALHRMGHHHIERGVTVPLTVGCSIAAYKNLQ